MTKRILWIPHFIFLSLAFGLSLFFIGLAGHCYFSDSEIWLLNISQKVLNPGNLNSIYHKWLFHALIFLSTLQAPSEADVYLWARWFTATIALLSLGLTAFVFTSAFDRKKYFWPLFIFLLSSTLFFSQGFRIRADIYSYFFHTLCLTAMYLLRGREIRTRHHILLTLLNLLLFATSVKVIYLFLTQFAAGLLFVGNLKGRSRKKYFWLIWQSHLSCVVFALFISVLSYFVAALPQLPTAISTALKFYFNTYETTAFSAPPFFSRESFMYVSQFILQNGLHVVILALGLATFLRWRENSSTEKALSLYGLLLFSIALLHNDKLPFFLAPMFTPLLGICFLRTFKTIESRWSKAPTAILLTLTPLMVYQNVVQIRFYNTLNSNQKQLEAVRAIETYHETYPHLKIYDVIGLLPRKNSIFAFVGPGEEAQRENIVKVVQQESPDLVLYVYKATMLEPYLGSYLKKEMILIGPGTWTKGRNLSPVNHPELFNKLQTINGKTYWIMPAPPEKYIYDVSRNQWIGTEILHLDETLTPSKTSPKYIAVPKENLFLGLSHFGPLPLTASPSDLFHFDTGF